MRDRELDVIIQRTITNKVKRQLKKHEEYWKRIPAYRRFLDVLYALEIIDMSLYWQHEGFTNIMVRDKHNEYEKLMCIKRARRYGRTLGCWLQSNADDERQERRLQAKLESQARYHEQYKQKEEKETREQFI